MRNRITAAILGTLFLLSLLPRGPGSSLRAQEAEEEPAPPAQPEKPDQKPGKSAAKKKDGKGSPKKDKAGKKAAPEAEEAAEGQGESSAPAGPGPGNPDFEYVKANLKNHLHGTLSLAEDGTVTIEYEFRSKQDAYKDDFQPPISTQLRDVFRWSVYREERVIHGETGVRISDAGSAFLNLWFTDDVEATVEFSQGINWTKRQFCAVVFQTKSKKAVGNNYGGQAATFSGQGFQKGTPATTETTVAGNKVKMGLRVKGGTYEAIREGKPRSSAAYLPREYGSGRVGFIWGGGVAGTLTTFSVKGRLDLASTAREMKKKTPSR